MKLLSVIIVSYNVRDYLWQCLFSLEKALKDIDADVWIVDNHSNDDTVAYIKESFPDVHIIANRHNMGFARANNMAIKKSEGRFVLLLNPDTIVGNTTMKECLSFIDAHEDAGAVGVRMLQTDGRDANESRRGVPDPMTSFYKIIGMCKHFPKNHRFAHYYMSYLSWDSAQQIEIVSGAFCMLRRAALDKVGLLDEDFFMYGEDIDLSYRILKGGYHNYYLPSRILHYKGESTVKSSFRYVHVFYEAMLIFFRKHYHNQIFLLSIPIKTAIYVKAFFALIGLVNGFIKHSLGFFNPLKKKVEYIVFNADEMTFDEMLMKISKSDHTKSFAVYYPKNQKIITHEGVYDNVDSVDEFNKR
nr:glycosyltransferase family 2 protein [Prevotella sp.]